MIHDPECARNPIEDRVPANSSSAAPGRGEWSRHVAASGDCQARIFAIGRRRRSDRHLHVPEADGRSTHPLGSYVPGSTSPERSLPAVMGSMHGGRPIPVTATAAFAHNNLDDLCGMLGWYSTQSESSSVH